MTSKTMVDEIPERHVSWPVARAKARLSELIDRVLASGPQVISRNGRDAVVVVSVTEWEQKSKRNGSLAAFFAASPLRGSGIDLERIKDDAGPIDV